tara:strand:- start:209 stop:574 length:366 start_codon:yes stop_codon:yes gene_type:complete
MEEPEPPIQEEKKEEDDVELSQDQIKNILEQNSKFLVKTIKDFQEKIQSLEREISQLRTQMTYNKLPTVKEIVSKKEDSEPNVEPKLGEVHNDTSSENHPRSGNYNDTDVSIEKFFYMGSK